MDHAVFRSLGVLTSIPCFVLLGGEPTQVGIDLQLLGQPSGRFEFKVDAAPRPLVIWYCRPSTVAPDTRVIFLMHGGNPQTASQACDIAGEHVRTHNALVLAPQFSTDAYPGDSYMFGGMVAPDGGYLPRSRWGFLVIEQLFDAARNGLGLRGSTYDIVGFSGGGQFVHRLVLFLPEARFRRAVAGSPGRYVFPTAATPFPYGLGNSPVDASQLRAAFGRDFILILGDRDTMDRDREPAAMVQGSNRFARGLRFFAAATDEANSLGVPFRWRLQILRGVGHDPSRVIRAALDRLFLDAAGR